MAYSAFVQRNIHEYTHNIDSFYNICSYINILDMISIRIQNQSNDYDY